MVARWDAAATIHQDARQPASRRGPATAIASSTVRQLARRHPRRHTVPPRQTAVAAAAAGSSWLNEEIEARPPAAPSPLLHSADLAPVPPSHRTFSAFDMAALWIGLVVSVSSWFLAGGLVDLGMSWQQGVACVFVGNALVLVPVVLMGHAGVKYGAPFPVLARSSFGVRGAVLPAVLRGMVAAGWFGVNTWLGGAAIHQMAQTLAGGALGGDAVIGWLGISAAQLACFLTFWAVQLGILLKGMEGIRLLEKYSAPVLILLTGTLLGWAVSAAGGFGPMLSTPSQFAPGMPQSGRFWSVFLPSLSSQMGYWASWHSTYQTSQATVVLFGAPISDPIALLSKLRGVGPICAALLGLTLATLTTNIAANVVAPANTFVSLAPGRFSFEGGALLTSVAGLLIKPWRLVASTGAFYSWLIAYSVLLGPISGIMLADYYLLRNRRLDLDALYSADPGAAYHYSHGWNPAAVAALMAGAVPTLPGMLHSLFGTPVPCLFLHLYNLAWFVGFFVGAATYVLLMRRRYWLQPQEVLVGRAA